MRSPVVLLLTAIGAASLGAATQRLPLLTPAKIERVSKLPPVAPEKRFTVQISEIGNARFDAKNPERTIEQIRELRFPIAFDPPQAAADVPDAIVPTSPTEFMTKHAGWTIRLKAKAQGSLVGIFGEADYTTFEFVRGGYGAVAGPVHTENGKTVIAPNRLVLPRLQTTTTHFHIFALPGEPYTVTLYKGKTPETHIISVRLD